MKSERPGHAATSTCNRKRCIWAIATYFSAAGRVKEKEWTTQQQNSPLHCGSSPEKGRRCACLKRCERDHEKVEKEKKVEK